MYRFDRHQTLRYGQNDRFIAYAQLFGFPRQVAQEGAKANAEFHPLFIHFLRSVAAFNESKRVSEVIRPRISDPSFGSIATVKQAGLDLRNNLKLVTYGHVSVLRTEVMQLLNEAFAILQSEDVRKQFGADNAWDTLEEIMRRYFNRANIDASRLSRMANAGRQILRWLAAPFIVQATNRGEFEALLLQIATAAEEWLTSAEAMGITRHRAGATKASPAGRVVPLRRARQA